jgi:tetratricopeptide (TPR) repeat protein
MTGPSQRAALGAVHSARPIVARLSMSRDKEDLAADIIDAWNAVESGLRTLVGGSPLVGQTLIRELRQRQLLSLEQANALAEFHAASERAAQTDYAPTERDISATRDAFLRLESGLMESDAERGPAGFVAPVAAVPVAVTPARDIVAAPAAPGRPGWMLPLVIVVVLVVVGAGAWLLFANRGGTSATFDQGVVAYQEGRREAATGAFNKAALDAPDDPMPHVYLARMQREQGNLTNANVEAVKAVQLGPNNGAALRELASTLFAQQNFDGARKFYIRAIQADTTDRLSEGFLGCSLMRLGNVAEGTKWIGRAGTGAWSACAAAPAGAPPMTK